LDDAKIWKPENPIFEDFRGVFKPWFIKSRGFSTVDFPFSRLQTNRSSLRGCQEMTTLRESIEDLIKGGGPPIAGPVGSGKAEVGTNRTGDPHIALLFLMHSLCVYVYDYM
jgi:hypothetical protein